jgi:hypothetical protein
MSNEHLSSVYQAFIFSWTAISLARLILKPNRLHFSQDQRDIQALSPRHGCSSWGETPTASTVEPLYLLSKPNPILATKFVSMRGKRHSF